MKQTTDFEADPELDHLLVSWRQGLDCDDTQWQRMRAAVESQLAGAAFADASLVPSGCIRPMAVSGSLSPASDIQPAGGHVAGERVGVRGPRRTLLPPHPGPLPHSGVHSESSTDCGGEGAETTAYRHLTYAPVRPRQQRGGAHSPQRWTMIAVVASVLCLALTGWLLDASPEEVTLHNPSPEVDLVSFTAADLHRQEELICELDRVFEHQLVGVHQSGGTVLIDITSQPLTKGEVPQLMMRFVWQQREGNGHWSTVKQEEVIGPLDHQFDLRPDSRMDVAYWSHLLPDRSLWMESTMTQPGGAVVRRAGQYQLNRPAEVWSQSSGEHHSRMLLVYELLKPCGRGVI